MNNLRKARNRRQVGADVLVVLFVILLSFSLWKQNEVVAPLPAPVVSQESAAPVKSETAPTSNPQSIASQIEAMIADEEAKYAVRKGDVLSLVFPKDWKQICKVNNLKDCNKIEVGQKLKLLGGALAQEVIHKTVKRGADGWLSIKHLNVDPYSRHRTPAKDRKILAGRGYTAAETEEYFSLLEQGQCAKESFARGTEYLWMSYGNTRVLEKLRATWNTPESGLVCLLSSGRTVVIMEVCENLAEVRSRAPTPSVIPEVTEVKEEIPPPVIAEVVPPVVVEAPPPVVVEEKPPEASEIEQIVHDADWDLGAFVGGDKDVRYAGFEGAYYPHLSYKEWGRYALGIGASGSLWDGKTSDGYGFSGETGAIGLAQKFSFDSRRDLGIKFPMIGGIWEQGHDKTGGYQQQRHASLWCAAVNYTDASREKDGKTTLPEWQLWTSLCGPLSQTKEHSWQGQALDSAPIKDIKYIFGVGGRVFLSKDLTGVFGEGAVAKKLQPFIEAGANKTAPNPFSGHAYIGLRTVNKVWGLGVGPHWSNLGTTLGATLTYDAGRDYKLRVQEERWDAMIKSLEAQGVAVD